jgi:hypothetical protein
MTTLPAITYLDSARNEGEMKTSFFGPIIDVIEELLGGAAESELTISSGSVTPTGASHTIDTESDASSDDLTNIATTNHPDGRLLLIQAEDAARTVVVKHQSGGAGQISLMNSEDVSLDDTRKFLLLKRNGSDWEEVFRSYNMIKEYVDDSNIFDVWRLTSFTSGSQTISANVSHVTESTSSSMTFSSGVFTFPTTGKWRVDHMTRFKAAGLAALSAQLSQDGGSTWNDISICTATGTDDQSASAFGVVDVRATASARVKFVQTASTTGYSQGISTRNDVAFMFQRLGKT